MSQQQAARPSDAPRSSPSAGEFVQRAIALNFQDRLLRAIVTGNDSNQVLVRRPGYSNADGQSYPKLEGTTVVADDEVLMLDVTGRGGWIVLGKILRN